MLEIILAGGWLMAPILLCSTLSMAIIIERFWTLRRCSVVPDGIGVMVEEWAVRHELDIKHLNELRTGSALGKVLAESCVAILFAVITWVQLRPAPPTKASRSVLGNSLAYSLPLIPHALLGQLNAIASRTLIAWHIGLGATGLFSMGFTVASVGTIVAMSLNQSFLPLFVSEVKRATANGVSERERDSERSKRIF